MRITKTNKPTVGMNIKYNHKDYSGAWYQAEFKIISVHVSAGTYSIICIKNGRQVKVGYESTEGLNDMILCECTIVTAERKQYHPSWW